MDAVPGAANDSIDRGEIVVRCWTEETAEASAVVVADARTAVAAILEGDSAAKSLEAVMLKLKLFVTVADEAAKVECAKSVT